jgi:hypothetical protein
MSWINDDDNFPQLDLVTNYHRCRMTTSKAPHRLAAFLPTTALCILAIPILRCSEPTANQAGDGGAAELGGDDGETGTSAYISLKSPIPLVVVGDDGEWITNRGTVFVSVRESFPYEILGQYIDADGERWSWIAESTEVGFDTVRNFPQLSPHYFTTAGERRPRRGIRYMDGTCDERCTLRFYYTEESFDGRDGEVRIWEEDRGDLRMWDEAPELWSYAELDYTFAERSEKTFMQSFDDATGLGIVSIGMVTLNLSGDDLRVTVEPHQQQMADFYHPAITPPRLDVSEFPEETDAGSER